MGRYLKQLYSLSLSTTLCPLEHFISSVVNFIPLPVEGGRPFHVVLDAALISPTSKSMPPVCFELPSPYYLPLMDLDFAGPLRCLSVENFLAIFTLLLRESKVVFTCCSNALLTDVMETFRCLLYPLTWSSCFITRLPDALTGVLQAPGGFMIGMHILEKKTNDINQESHLISIEEGNKHTQKFDIEQLWINHLQSGTFIADLTENKIYLYEQKNTELLSSSRTSQILRSLPNSSFRKLSLKIQSIADKFLLAPQKFDEVGLIQFDSAFDYKSFDENILPGGRKWSDFPTLEVRDAFLIFMCEILGDFSRYIRSPRNIPLQGATIQELFKIEVQFYYFDYYYNNNISLLGISS